MPSITINLFEKLPLHSIAWHKGVFAFTKIKLPFSPNDTVEKAFKDYMNRFNFSYNSGIDFFYHGNKIDKFSFLFLNYLY